ncbi:MAG: ribosome maturation factor RimP [Alphaproteobacteria bacterium]|nr:ribosome maturation factor RimP [Alphaproteobacteria bacterium]MDP6565156.1 ribosome maturation factor RimP [Alphaproteobacteria bacterium]MDP6812323.1 ribosome maturation factor RimP [Alphaproteobacteria bacterium]
MPAANEQLAEVERLIEPSVEAMGFRLVRLRFMGGQARPTLQVMAERLDDREMNVDDCADLSRAISALLDVEDPIAGAYLLEVSSPGIDRPLVRPDDFLRFAGYQARIEACRLIDGRRRFVGRLLGLRDGRVQIALADAADDEGEYEIPIEDVERAKLVLTDELIQATLKKRKH